jgi:hypothetical protein
MNIKKLLLTAAFLGVSSPVLAQSVPTISTTDISVSGLNSSSGLQNASTSTYFSNTGETLLVVRGGGTTVTATINSAATSVNTQAYGPIALTSPTVSIPSGSVVVFGPFQPGRYNIAGTNLVGVSFTSVTGVSVTAINVPQP